MFSREQWYNGNQLVDTKTCMKYQAMEECDH